MKRKLALAMVLAMAMTTMGSATGNDSIYGSACSCSRQQNYS